MSTDNKITDRGKYLKMMVEDTGISIMKLVQKIGYKDRASYYSHIGRPDLPMDTLIKYAKALNYSIGEDFPETVSKVEEENMINYGPVPQSYEEAMSLMEHWKNKYIQSQEKYIILLEERNKQ